MYSVDWDGYFNGFKATDIEDTEIFDIETVKEEAHELVDCMCDIADDIEYGVPVEKASDIFPVSMMKIINVNGKDYNMHVSIELTEL